MGAAASPRVAPRLLTVGEVAERLGVSTATVYALCKRGTLRHVRVANAIRVPEAALAVLLR
ncbi:MAG: DNA-binding protein [Myxococcales bacterium]|nr:MAG: DNA-binding protein [Myxococcales bacterium]